MSVVEEKRKAQNEEQLSSRCNINESDYKSKLPPPPDGGWGWFVVFGSFMIHVIADGVTYSFGIFIEEFMHYFGVGAITNRYGCRVATMAGAVLATFGFAISSVMNSIPALYLTIGVCTGFGFGLIYLPAIVSVSMYFEKKRAFATGIAVCGSGLGTFIMSPVTTTLIENYKWQGAILITSGIIALCFFFGLLFKPLKSLSNEEADCDKEKNIANFEEAEKMLCLENGAPEICLNGEALRPIEKQYQANSTRMALSHPVISNLSKSDNSDNDGDIIFYGDSKQNIVLKRKDIFYSGSLYNLREFRDDPDGYSKNVTLQLEESETVGNAFQEWLKAFKKLVDFSLLKDSIYIVFVVSNFLTSIGFNVPYVYTFDRAQNTLKMPKEDASYLISIIGIANTIGRIVLGYVSDKPWLNTLYLYNTCLAICGLCLGLSNFCVTYTTQAIYCAVFGVTSGAYVGLTSVVLVELIGLDQLTHGFGLLLLFQGIASVIGPPIIGGLKDWLGTYDVGFYLAGFIIFVSGVMLFILPWMQRRDKKKTKPIVTNP
ncbi:SLC16A14 [Lepeophtheirus salmonis]|uniref:SLC16A14 n=1 Tax=Lepeophtheirus salmonis TaxID=72036 RepID=A0A7R8CYK4_LEPSM|nr:SLC16A14 [Lepeophtheirus salmonis]CAF2925089.1 SLC16A14 [Lepeophtheirus salmonis]